MVAGVVIDTGKSGERDGECTQIKMFKNEKMLRGPEFPLFIKTKKIENRSQGYWGGSAGMRSVPATFRLFIVLFMGAAAALRRANQGPPVLDHPKVC